VNVGVGYNACHSGVFFMLEDWLTTEQAAETSGYHADHIRRLIRAKKLKARKFGPVWQVSREGLLAYLQQTREMGAKRGPKRGD
jgi:excisionase family DNA binding protein